MTTCVQVYIVVCWVGGEVKHKYDICIILQTHHPYIDDLHEYLQYFTYDTSYRSSRYFVCLHININIYINILQLPIGIESRW